MDQLARGRLVGNTSGDVVLTLPKEQLRQLLVMLGKASESEDQGELLHDAEPDKFPHRFPDIGIAPAQYTEAFDILLAALDEEKTLEIDRPAV